MTKDGGYATTDKILIVHSALCNICNSLVSIVLLVPSMSIVNKIIS